MDMYGLQVIGSYHSSSKMVVITNQIPSCHKPDNHNLIFTVVNMVNSGAQIRVE
jgi:hypothetical protein